MKLLTVILATLVAGTLYGGEVEDRHAKLNKGFASVVEKADKKLEDAKKQREKDVVEATEKYLRSLKKVMDGYTKAAKLDKALEVRAKIEELEKLLEAGKAIAAGADDKKPGKAAGMSEKEMEKTLGYELKWRPVGAKKGPSGHYYKYVEGLTTWDNACQKAKEQGGYLATVTTKKEFDFVVELSGAGEGVGQHAVFVGGSAKGKVITWITGETTDDDVPVHDMPHRYNRVSIRKGWSGGLEASGQYGTGRNGSGVPMVKGFVIEWNK